jgi:general secretion pathway protein C
VGGAAHQHNGSIVNTMAQASRLPGELASQLLAQAPRWIWALLIVLIGVRSAFLVADLAGLSGSTGAARLPSTAVGTRKVVDIPSILRANLFGRSATPTGVDAPVTSMNLNLALVIAANDPKRGFAAIGTTPTDVKVYAVGDDVPGGARLHEVYVDRVLLDRGGSIEALLVPLREGAQPTASPPMAASGPGSLERVQQAISNNPAMINQVMTRQAVFQDGKLLGIRVNPGPNSQAFNRLGLRANDIVKSINGTPLDDQSRANEVFNVLNGAGMARVSIQRNGREMDLNLNLADIANEAERLAESPQAPPAEPDPGPDSTR